MNSTQLEGEETFELSHKGKLSISIPLLCIRLALKIILLPQLVDKSFIHLNLLWRWKGFGESASHAKAFITRRRHDDESKRRQWKERAMMSREEQMSSLAIFFERFGRCWP
jgi:hypothetical protein